MIAEHRTATLEELQERFIDAVGRFAKEIGITGYTEGKIFGQLLLAFEPLTQDDLVEKLEISRGKVSTALKTLTEQNFVKKTGLKGSRRDYYEAELNLWKVTLSYVLHQIGGRIGQLTLIFDQILEEGRKLKKAGDSSTERRNAALLVRRVQKLQGFVKAAQGLLKQVQVVAQL